MSDIAHSEMAFGVFGTPPAELAPIPPGARQFSPLHPGAACLDAIPSGSLGGMTMYAVPGTLERRRDVALMLRALEPGAPFTVLAPKDMGGGRLQSELAEFGCEVESSAKRHHRICVGIRPAELKAIEPAISDGAPRRLSDTGLWSQPGIFSWDRIDPGTALLLDALPRLSGHGADLGCGIGILGHGILTSEAVTRLEMVDIDRRAVEAARRNVDDTRVCVHWADVRQALPLAGLDFVVSNPPFHDAGTEDRTLGATFIRQAAGALRAGGHLWLVANRHLPYEPILKTLFRRATPIIEAHGFKVISAVK